MLSRFCQVEGEAIAMVRDSPGRGGPGRAGALPILCLLSLGTYRGVSELRTQGLEAVSGSVNLVSQVLGTASAMLSHRDYSGPAGRGSQQVFGILCLASFGANRGVWELRARVCLVFRIQAYVSLGCCAGCIAPGGAAWDSVSPTSPNFPVSF